MLKAKIVKEEFDKLTDVEKANYVVDSKDPSKYLLQVESVDGVALEDVKGLKNTVEALRTSEKSLKTQLMDIQNNFKDIDPEAARNALAKYNEIQNWSSDTKTKELVENTKRELVKQHESAISKTTKELEDTRNQLHEAIVTTKIVEALTTEQGNVELLLPHVKKFVHMNRGADGRYYPEVINDKGDPRIGDSAGNPMTISQLVAEMKGNKVYAAGFPGANQSGSGNASGGSDKRTAPAGSTVVAASDQRGMSSNLENIASGKTVVDMTK